MGGRRATPFSTPSKCTTKRRSTLLPECAAQGWARLRFTCTTTGIKRKTCAPCFDFKDLLAQRPGLLSRYRDTGELAYGFVHGNWALDNSHPEGRACGVNDELTILRETGCFADFTMPSAPSPTQTRKINSIYYAVDDPGKPKSHDWGMDVGTATGTSRRTRNDSGAARAQLAAAQVGDCSACREFLPSRQPGAECRSVETLAPGSSADSHSPGLVFRQAAYSRCT